MSEDNTGKDDDIAGDSGAGEEKTRWWRFGLTLTPVVRALLAFTFIIFGILLVALLIVNVFQDDRSDDKTVSATNVNEMVSVSKVIPKVEPLVVTPSTLPVPRNTTDTQFAASVQQNVAELWNTASNVAGLMSVLQQNQVVLSQNIQSLGTNVVVLAQDVAGLKADLADVKRILVEDKSSHPIPIQTDASLFKGFGDAPQTLQTPQPRPKFTHRVKGGAGNLTVLIVGGTNEVPDIDFSVEVEESGRTSTNITLEVIQPNVSDTSRVFQDAVPVVQPRQSVPWEKPETQANYEQKNWSTPQEQPVYSDRTYPGRVTSEPAVQVVYVDRPVQTPVVYRSEPTYASIGYPSTRYESPVRCSTPVSYGGPRIQSALGGVALSFGGYHDFSRQTPQRSYSAPRIQSALGYVEGSFGVSHDFSNYTPGNRFINVRPTRRVLSEVRTYGGVSGGGNVHYERSSGLTYGGHRGNGHSDHSSQRPQRDRSHSGGSGGR